MNLNGENNDIFSKSNGLDIPPMLVLLLMLLIMAFCILIGFSLTALMSHFKGLDYQEAMLNLSTNNSLSTRNFIRTSLGISHLSMFVFPSIGLAIFMSRKYWTHYLSIQKLPHLTNILLGVILILSSFPLAYFTFWVNKQIPLPAWAMTMEDSTNKMIENMLLTEVPYELWFNLLIVAAIPALGEELIFRGILQKNLERLFNNPITAIWVAALLFSAFHMQFQGFLPRLVLGALLGYLFYWTRNLWVPIFAHFAYNGSQIIGQYLLKADISSVDIEQADQLPIGITIISSIFVLFICFFIKQYNQKLQPNGRA